MRLEILTPARDRLAAAPYTSLRAEARPNQASELSVLMPRALEPGDGLAPEEAARLGAFLEVLSDSGDLLHSGVIVARRAHADAVSLTALTEEVLLEAHTLPRGYARALSGLPITDLARALLWGREVAQVTTQTEWQAGALDGLDATTEPGVVMLAKQDGRYRESGTGRWTFHAANVTEWESWERVRWLADHDEVVRVEVRYRASGGAWSPWAAGGLPDTIGVEVIGDAATAPTLEVEARLITEDTESPDPEDNPTGVTPYLFALEVVARTAPAVTAGAIPTTEPDTPVVFGVPEAENALKALAEACAAVGWEFRVRRGRLDLAPELGDDRTSEVLLRESTNLALHELGEDDDDWCNVLTAYGPGEGIDALTVTRRHEASIQEHGLERRRVMDFPTATDRADLIAKADEWLEAHAYPLARLTGDAVYPAGEEPTIALGDTVRVSVPSSGLVRSVRVMGLLREERAGKHALTLTLGTPERGLLEAITAPERDAQKRIERRPLSPPVGFRLAMGGPGLRVLLNPLQGATGCEMRYSNVRGFDPDAEGVRVDLGRSTRANIPNATPGVRYYARARAYDEHGRRSAWTPEVSALAGGLDVDFEVPDGSITIAKLAAGLEPVRIVSSLPLVPDPAYTVGESIVLLATGNPDDKRRLYRLVSETGVPSEDWRPVTQDAEITIEAGMVLADGAVIGAIQAGAIRSEEIAAGAIRAEHLQLTGASYHVNPAHDDLLAFEGTLKSSKGQEPSPGHDAVLGVGLFGGGVFVNHAPLRYLLRPSDVWTAAAYVAPLQTWADLGPVTWADL